MYQYNNSWIFHIDFNSFFATVEQQANPRLRGKPIGVTGGDRTKRTVIGAASIEAKARGVRGAMSLTEAKKICPEIILVRGDSDKYLECTKRFLNVLKRYTDQIEVFSIDEVFLSIHLDARGPVSDASYCPSSLVSLAAGAAAGDLITATPHSAEHKLFNLAANIKQSIRKEVGEFITCSIGISYNKMLAKLAGSLYKPDGLVGIFDEESAKFILDRVDLSEICGIGFRTQRRLNNMGVFNFSDLRKVPLENLLASFKSYGETLYNFSRGIGDAHITPFYLKEEVKSIGHRHTLYADTGDPLKIKQTLLKLSELIARRLRSKNLEGKTVSTYFRYAFNLEHFKLTGQKFEGFGMQCTISYSANGLEIFKAGLESFLKMWNSSDIRMIGISVSNLRSKNLQTLSLFPEERRDEILTKVSDKINDKYGEFTLKRGILINSTKVKRMANPFLADRRFKI